MILLAVLLAAYNIYNNLATSLSTRLQTGAYVPEIQVAGKLNTAVFDAGEQFAVYQYTLEERYYSDSMNRIRTM